jgi:hypothetical protein
MLVCMNMIKTKKKMVGIGAGKIHKTFRCAYCKALIKNKQENYIEGKICCCRDFYRVKKANADKRYGVVRIKNPSWLDYLGKRHFRNEEEVNPPKRVKRITRSGD